MQPTMAVPGADTVRAEFDAMCRHLNMDLGTMDVAWKSYADLKEFYTLEVSEWQLADSIICQIVLIQPVE